MDPDLAGEWDHFEPALRCGGCTALARAAEQTKEADHPGALRFILGLRHGWQERKAALVAARAERAAASKHSHGPEGGEH